MEESLSAFREALRDRYELDRLVGRGGMADVYLATDRRHGRPVAVKILRARAGLSVDAVRFAREIETAARLQHPNILPVYDSGEAGGCLFFVMPFVEGGSLRSRLEEQRTLSWADALSIVREVGDALAFAHTRSVVHRDIKPENILFLAGHAVVADFGIAKAMREPESDRITLAGHGLGTPEYMSPEQAFGEAGIDARSDIYSLACVLHEMLSGAPPWTDDQPFALLMRKTTESPPELRTQELSGIPARVGAVLQRALAREPEERFTSIASMMDALVAARSHQAETDAPHVAAPAVDRVDRNKADTPSVAVLPFVNLGGDTADEYLCDGLSEELIQALGQVPGIRVVARTSSFRFKGFTGDVRPVGNELGVSALLEGSGRRQGNRLRISARLIDVASGFEKWSERFDRQFADVFDVQDEIARAIVVSLEGTLQPRAGELVQAATGNMTAYDEFLEARFSWNQRTPAALARSVELLQQSLARDPMFVAAHAALAETCVTLAMYGAGAPAALMVQARASAERALALRVGFSPARAALACVHALHDWNWSAAEREFGLAAQRSHASATVFQWWAANLLVPQQRFGEAHAQLARARAIDPLSAAVGVSVGVAYHSAGHHDAALREFEHVLARDPQFGMAHYFLARTWSALGEHAAALEAIVRAETMLGDSIEALAARGVLHATAGQHDEAAAIIARLETMGRERYVSPVAMAELLAADGRDDSALTMLGQGVATRAPDMVWIGARPAFQRLAASPNFRKVVAPVGLPL
jgi:TolB-like protein